MAEKGPIAPAVAPQAGEDTVIVMTDEDGNESEFEIVTTLEIAGRKYLVLEASDPMDEGSALLRVDTDPVTGEEHLVDIEDDDEFERLAIAADAVLQGYDYCRVCGCTDACGCEGGCSWVKPGLCSSCVGKEGAPENTRDPASP